MLAKIRHEVYAEEEFQMLLTVGFPAEKEKNHESYH